MRFSSGGFNHLWNPFFFHHDLRCHRAQRNPDRLAALFVWKLIFACLRGIITGWLLASWVVYFVNANRARYQEKWIQY